MAAVREQKRRLLTETLEGGLFPRCRGRCECEGLCGHNHLWDPTRPAARCTAIHGVNIVRKIGHPSCVWNAPLQGFTKQMEDHGLPGPRTHFAKKYVTEGIEVEFVHPEWFELDKVSQVWLKVVHVTPGKADECFRMFCQFCAHHAEQKGALVA